MPAGKITRRTKAFDHIVERTLAGQYAEIDPNARSLFLRSYRSDDWYQDPDGLLIPFHSLPIPTHATLSAARRYGGPFCTLAESVMPRNRFQAIVHNETVPSADECMLFQLAFIEAAMKDTTLLDADDCPAYFVFAVRHTDGRAAYALISISGYAFTTLRRKFHGFFATEADVTSHLETIGLVLPQPLPA